MTSLTEMTYWYLVSILARFKLHNSHSTIDIIVLIWKCRLNMSVSLMYARLSRSSWQLKNEPGVGRQSSADRRRWWARHWRERHRARCEWGDAKPESVAGCTTGCRPTTGRQRSAAARRQQRRIPVVWHEVCDPSCCANRPRWMCGDNGQPGKCQHLRLDLSWVNQRLAL